MSNETLQNIIENYCSGLLSTNRIKVSSKKFSNEKIEFSPELIVNTISKSSFYIDDISLSLSTFRRSEFINMQFLYINFSDSWFEKCSFENCSFENTDFGEVEVDTCVFKNCRFIDCDLNKMETRETVFNECTFVRSSFTMTWFDSCHFLKPLFEDMDRSNFASGVVIDSKFSDSKQSIEFEGEKCFVDIFGQIEKLDLD